MAIQTAKAIFNSEFREFIYSVSEIEKDDVEKSRIEYSSIFKRINPKRRELGTVAQSLEKCLVDVFSILQIDFGEN